MTNKTNKSKGREKPPENEAMYVSHDKGVAGASGWVVAYETKKVEYDEPVEPGTLLKLKRKAAGATFGPEAEDNKDNVVMFLRLEELHLSTHCDWYKIDDNNLLTEEERKDLEQDLEKVGEEEKEFTTYYALVLHGEKTKKISINSPDNFFDYFELAKIDENVSE